MNLHYANLLKPDTIIISVLLVFLKYSMIPYYLLAVVQLLALMWP